MLQLENKTPFEANLAMFPNEHAIDTLYVLVKATFNINKILTLSDVQISPNFADEYWTEPGKSSIKYASDYHTGKASSDIVMIGHAIAPIKYETRQLDVALRVGEVSKKIRVFGNRQWKNGQITQAEPFKTMALVYEKAFGGVQIQDGEIKKLDQRNPVGRGFSGGRSVEEMNGVPLPNLENPDELITHHEQQPFPACFGISSPQWLPRSAHAGNYDKQWESQRAPYLPEDFNKRFCNSAHPDLIYPDFLSGGEQVEITNMHPNGNIKFNIPKVNVVSDVTISNTSIKPNFNLETLIIEPNQLRFSMVWRASVQCDKSLLKVSAIKVALQR